MGRTGRGGRAGHATTYMTAADSRIAPQLADVLQAVAQQVPEWLQHMAQQQAVTERQQQHATAGSSSRAQEKVGDGQGSASEQSLDVMQAMAARVKRMGSLASSRRAADRATPKVLLKQAAGSKGLLRVGKHVQGDKARARSAGARPWGAFLPEAGPAVTPASTTSPAARAAKYVLNEEDEQLLKEWRAVIMARAGRPAQAASSRSKGSKAQPKPQGGAAGAGRASGSEAASIKAGSQVATQAVTPEAAAGAVGARSTERKGVEEGAGTDVEAPPAVMAGGVQDRGGGGSAKGENKHRKHKAGATAPAPQMSAKVKRLFHAF